MLQPHCFFVELSLFEFRSSYALGQNESGEHPQYPAIMQRNINLKSCPVLRLIQPSLLASEGFYLFLRPFAYLLSLQAQTPQQRRANAKYANINEMRMGKPESAYKKKDTPKSPVGKIAVGMFCHLYTYPIRSRP